MALVDNVALYALGYAAHESHPMRLDQYCLNTVQRKYPCSDCADACPKTSISPQRKSAGAVARIAIRRYGVSHAGDS